jgi:WD40 repeat protein
VSEGRARRVNDLFTQVLEIEPDARGAFLDDNCAPETREEIEALLRAHETMGEFLATSALDRIDEIAPEARPLLEPGDRIAAYQIVRVIGSGGAGTVYEAEQQSPHRTVALKVMRSGIGSEASQRRFQDEAEVLARLEHPDIAHVYEAGVHEGTPWFAMEQVADARTVIEFAEGLTVADRLRIFARICDAIHHGHQKGVIHRDLKPANVLVHSTGRPKVIDFGIARVEGLSPERREIVGTIPYMSPEQLTPGEDVDVRSDVYSLGVLLYEFVSGKRPYEVPSTSITEASRVIREEPPAALDRSLHGDIESIVRKALEKERDGRYASAAALADDIRRHLAHEPVAAVPASLLYQLRKFARRQRAAFLAVAAIVLVSVAAALISGWMAFEKERQRKVAEMLALENAKERNRAEFQAYVANIAAAYAALRTNDVGDARLHLQGAPTAHRNWEWHHLYGRLDMSIETLDIGKRIAAGALSSDGQLIAMSNWSHASALHGVCVRELETGKVIHEFPRPGQRVDALAFSRDGRWLVLGFKGGAIEICDRRSGSVRRLPDAHGKQITMVAFAPEGERFATGSYDSTIKLWEAASGRLLGTLSGHDGKIFCVRFDPSGERLFSGGGDKLVRIWDPSTQKEVGTLAGHTSNVEDLAPSPDGSILATGSMDHTVRLWNVRTRKLLATGEGHTNGIKAVAFSPDGMSFASASIDRTVRLWSVPEGRELASLKGHTDRVYFVAYHPNGRRIFSLAFDGALRCWSAAHQEDVASLGGHRRMVSFLSFSDSGGRLLSVTGTGVAKVWDVAGRLELTESQHRAARTRAFVAMGPRGESLFTIMPEGYLGKWSIPEQRLLDKQRSPGSWPRAPVRVGERILCIRNKNTIVVRDAASFEVLAEWMAADTGIMDMLVTDPRARFLGMASIDGVIRIRDANSFEALGTVTVGEHRLIAVALSPDGQRLAHLSAGASAIRLVDWRRNSELANLEGHAGMVFAIAFSPDGTRLASGGSDGTVRLWDVETGRQVLVLRAHPHSTTSLAWSPDGKCLASGGGDWFPESCLIRLWEAK